MKLWMMNQRFAFNKQYVALNSIPVLAILVMFALSGCQPLTSKKSMIPWGKKEKEPKAVPDRILAVWTDTVLHQQGQKGVRGFGGRVYFYEKDKTDPIEVEGSLAVYAFDAEDDAMDTQKPLRKFVFTPEHLAGHMSKTSIGPSYSVWLPWSAVGDPPQKLSLITRFEGVYGGTTISDPVVKLLPGVAKSSDKNGKSSGPTGSNVKSTASSDQGVQQASFTEAKDTSNPSKREQRPVETIELPPGFHRHLKNSEGTRSGRERDSELLQSFDSGVTTQVYDTKNPLPSSKTPGDPTKNSGDSEGIEPRLFSSSRPNRNNIRQGSWLKPDRRLQDGIDRKQSNQPSDDKVATIP